MPHYIRKAIKIRVMLSLIHMSDLRELTLFFHNLVKHKNLGTMMLSIKTLSINNIDSQKKAYLLHSASNKHGLNDTYFDNTLSLCCVIMLDVAFHLL